MAATFSGYTADFRLKAQEQRASWCHGATVCETKMKQIAVRIFQKISTRFGQVLLAYRAALVMGVQAGLIVAANFTAFAFRFDGQIPALYAEAMRRGMPFVCGVYLTGLWAFGIHRGLWRYVGLHDLGRILWACVASTAAIFVLVHPILGWVEYPRSVILGTGLLAGLYVAGIRLLVRWFREWLQIVGPTARRVLIVGAGNAGELLVRNMQMDPSYNYRPVAFVDDAPVKQRAKIHGIPVAGSIDDIRRIADRFEVHEILVAIPSASLALKQRILAAVEGATVPIKILPSVKQLLEDPTLLQQVRPMSLVDLLQREPIQTDQQELHPLIEGKTVLVTGAGGSIGSELCRQIAQYRPGTLVLFERYENALHGLLLELQAAFPTMAILPIVADITMPERVAEVFRQTGPDIVFHAAAHKHVPLMELHPKEAVRNNVWGTHVVAEAALASGVSRFVLISTDKAVNPSSVMGATKRIAEHLIQRISQRGPTRFTAVRFGNVLGSNGSVVPLFAEQIKKGGPVTVTSPEIKRFFMTIPEAVQLVLQASVMGQGGEVFVLDMGEQIKIADLARNMIVLSGLVPGKDIAIEYTGLRVGEKLYEELFEESEQVLATSHPKINRAVGEPLQVDDCERWLEALHLKLLECEDEELLQDLKRIVPTFLPASPQRVS